MTKLKITVTKEILERSKDCEDGSAKNCAIALAVRTIFPNALVGQTFMIPFGRTDGYKGSIQKFTYGPSNCVALPESATKFIRQFDQLEPEERSQMPEISFEIEIPDEAIEKINIEELRPLLTNHPNLALV